MKKLISWTLIFAIYLGYITPVSLVANGQIIGKAMEQKTKDVPEGLKFRLSEGVEGAETRERQQLPSTDPLSDGDTNSLLKRIPEIKSTTDDKTEFAKRIGTLPAPKTGNKIPVKFPSDDGRGTPKIDTTGQTLAGHSLFARGRGAACAGSECDVFAADGCGHVAGRGGEVYAGRINTAGRRELALARDKDADVRYDEAFPYGDEIHRPRSRRNQGSNGPVIAEGSRMDIHHASAEGRDDDPEWRYDAA